MNFSDALQNRSLMEILASTRLARLAQSIASHLRRLTIPIATARMAVRSNQVYPPPLLPRQRFNVGSAAGKRHSLALNINCLGHMESIVDLTRFRGHFNVWKGGVCNDEQTEVQPLRAYRFFSAG